MEVYLSQTYMSRSGLSSRDEFLFVRFSDVVKEQMMTTLNPEPRDDVLLQTYVQ